MCLKQGITLPSSWQNNQMNPKELIYVLKMYNFQVQGTESTTQITLFTAGWNLVWVSHYCGPHYVQAIKMEVHYQNASLPMKFHAY
jgi:hypothetical protein